MRKRAATLVVDKGEVFLKRKGRQVEVVTTVEDQRRRPAPNPRVMPLSN